MLRYVACYHDHVRRFDRCHGIEREKTDDKTGVQRAIQKVKTR